MEAEHGHWMRQWRNIVKVRDYAPKHGTNAQRLEIGARYHLNDAVLGPVPSDEAGWRKEACEQAREDLVTLAQLPEYRITEKGFLTTTELNPIDHLGVAQVDLFQLLWTLDGQRAKHNRVEEAENSGIGADAEA